MFKKDKIDQESLENTLKVKQSLKGGAMFKNI